MKIIVFGDLHSNYCAAQYVMEKKRAADSAWCLGDFVGRGPHLPEIIRCLKEFSQISDAWVIGNHEGFVWDLIDENAKSRFNREVAHTLCMHRDLLRECDNHTGRLVTKERNRLSWVAEQYAIVHATPNDPPGVETQNMLPWSPPLQLSRDLIQPFAVEAQKMKLVDAVLFCGHTHVPMFLNWKFGERSFQNFDENIRYGVPMHIPDGITVINPGSVGNPRVGSNTYAELDTDANTVTFQAFRLSQKSKDCLRDAMQGLGFDANIIRSFRTPPGTERLRSEYPIFYRNLQARENDSYYEFIEVGDEYCHTKKEK